MTSLRIDQLGGNCPVQAEGTVDGRPFYFRARGAHWSFGVGDDPILEEDCDFYYEEEYGTQYEAGWMDDEEARKFIDKAVALYRSSLPLPIGEKT